MTLAQGGRPPVVQLPARGGRGTPPARRWVRPAFEPVRHRPLAFGRGWGRLRARMRIETRSPRGSGLLDGLFGGEQLGALRIGVSAGL